MNKLPIQSVIYPGAYDDELVGVGVAGVGEGVTVVFTGLVVFVVVFVLVVLVVVVVFVVTFLLIYFY